MSEKTNLRPWQEEDDTDFTDESIQPVDVKSEEPAADADSSAPKAAQPRKKARKARAAKKTSRASASSNVDISGKKAKAEVASMYLHWKRIHEISGKIMANLEEFSEQIKNQ